MRSSQSSSSSSSSQALPLYGQRYSGKASDPVTVKIPPSAPRLLLSQDYIYITLLRGCGFGGGAVVCSHYNFPTTALVSRDDYDYITGMAIIPSAHSLGARLRLR